MSCDVPEGQDRSNGVYVEERGLERRVRPLPARTLAGPVDPKQAGERLSGTGRAAHR